MEKKDVGPLLVSVERLSSGCAGSAQVIANANPASRYGTALTATSRKACKTRCATSQHRTRRAIIDPAGRLHSDEALMAEIKKSATVTRTKSCS